MLILQGERDPFGRAGEVESYVLSDRVRVSWLADGDHGLKPRKSSGATFEQNIQSAARMATEFMMGLSVKRS